MSETLDTGVYVSKGGHVVSYELHYGPVPKGMVVMHSCNTKACVNIEHLSLGTHEQNSTNAAKDGLYLSGEAHKEAHPAETIKRGENNGNCLYSDEVVDAIRESRESNRALARKYGCDKKYIKLIREWQIRTDRPKRDVDFCPDPYKKGLEDDDVREILSSSLSHKELAEEFEVDPKTIRMVRERKLYANVAFEGILGDWPKKPRITPELEHYIQNSEKEVSILAKELGMYPSTIHRIRKRKK